jgi:hypothetical protein
MARAIYYVLSAGGGWKVRLGDKDTAFDTQSQAIDAAVAAARKSHANGHDSQVLVQRENGQWRSEWTYGNDPERYPG